MFSSLTAFLAGFVAGGIARISGLGLTWSCTIGLLVLLAVTITISFIVRRKVKQVNAHIQQVMEEVQHRIMMRQNQFMRRPIGTPQRMMQELEKDQAAGIRRAIDTCDEFTPLFRWSPLLAKQVNTMKMAFYYQIRDFKMVDELMPRCIFFDPQSVCIKMARMYMLKAEGIDKLFRKKCRGLKDPACVLPYSLYAWILVKQERYDDALKLLVECKRKTDNEVILRNWEHLINKKYKSFSNAGLGETWYALGLETPKMPRQNIRYR